MTLNIKDTKYLTL